MLTKNRQGLRCAAGLPQEQSCGTDKASYRKMGAFFYCLNRTGCHRIFVNYSG